MMKGTLGLFDVLINIENRFICNRSFEPSGMRWLSMLYQWLLWRSVRFDGYVKGDDVERMDNRSLFIAPLSLLLPHFSLSDALRLWLLDGLRKLKIDGHK